MEPPRIVSLAVSDETQQEWDALRRQWFPAQRLQVGAHVTLFHALPADLDLDTALREATDRAPFDVEVTGAQPLGRGAALRLASGDLEQLHDRLQEQWWEHLTKQDRQRLRAHVTVQNKVDADTARDTVRALEGDFTAYATTALGLDLWRYDGGPWTHLQRYAFTT